MELGKSAHSRATYLSWKAGALDWMLEVVFVIVNYKILWHVDADNKGPTKAGHCRYSVCWNQGCERKIQRPCQVLSSIPMFTSINLQSVKVYIIEYST